MKAALDPPEPASRASPLRVLVLTQHFWPEQFRINGFVEDLREAGAEVAVLTGQPNYPAGRTFDGYRWNRIGAERHPSGYEIFRVPLVPRGKGGALRMAANYLSFLASAIGAGPFLLRGRPFDIIFVYGTSPIFQAFAAFPLRRLKGAPIVLWVQDLWPGVLAATGYVRNGRILALVERVVAALYRRVDLILAQSEAFADAIRPMANKVPVAYFPNPGDSTDSNDEEESGVRLPPGFNIVFAGNLGRAQALETVVEAAELLRGERDIRINLFGSGAMEDWMRRQIEERRLGNLVLGGRLPAKAMPSIFRQSSALLLTLASDEMVSRTIPSKLQSYLEAGVPIIAAAAGEPARIVLDSGAGIACAPESAPALVSAIIELRGSSEKEIDAMRVRGRAYHQAHFEARNLAERLMKQFRELLVERRGEES